MQNKYENGITPIQHANTYRMRFAIPFPDYVDTSKIGVHVNKMERLLQIGGISHLRVCGNVDEETSRFTPMIVGYDSQGNAYAGKKGEKVSVPEFTASEDVSNPNLNISVTRPHSATWKNGVINLNICEITERIRQEKRWARGVYDLEAWAHHLDGSIRKGISEIGVRHLAVGLNRYGWVLAAFQYGLMGAFEIGGGSPSVETLAFRIPFVSAVLNTLDFIRFGNQEEGFRWSVFYGPQFDRALLLKVMTTKGGLVKSLGKSNDNDASSSSLLNIDRVKP